MSTWKEIIADPAHPIWTVVATGSKLGLLTIAVIAVVPFITATNYDVSLDGEAGLAGGVILARIIEWYVTRSKG